MVKIPFLYQKLANALEQYMREQAIQSELQRRKVLSLITHKLRIRKEERNKVLRELQKYGVLRKRSQRRVELIQKRRWG